MPHSDWKKFSIKYQMEKKYHYSEETDWQQFSVEYPIVHIHANVARNSQWINTMISKRICTHARRTMDIVNLKMYLIFFVIKTKTKFQNGYYRKNQVKWNFII
jgi:hypothetical protein